MSTIIVLIIANNYQIYAICVCVYFCYTLSTYFMQEYINVHCFYSSIYLQVYGAGFRFWSGPGFRPDPSEYLYDVPHSLMLLNMQGRLGSLVFVIYHICYIPNIVSGCLALVGWAGWSAGQVGRHVKCRRRESNGR